MLALLLTIHTAVSPTVTCGEYSKLSKKDRITVVEGMHSGFLSGVAAVYKTVLVHELAGSNSRTVATAAEMIIREVYKKFRADVLSEQLVLFCKEDKGGKLPMFYVFLAVTKKMGGGSDEDFNQDVDEMLTFTYSPKELDRLFKKKESL